RDDGGIVSLELRLDRLPQQCHGGGTQWVALGWHQVTDAPREVAPAVGVGEQPTSFVLPDQVHGVHDGAPVRVASARSIHCNACPDLTWAGVTDMTVKPKLTASAVLAQSRVMPVPELWPDAPLAQTPPFTSTSSQSRRKSKR